MIYIPEKEHLLLKLLHACIIMGFLIDEVKFRFHHMTAYICVVCAVTSYDTLYVQWKQFSPRQIQPLPITAATALESV